MNSEQMYELVNQLAVAKSQQDIDGAMQIYHPDIELHATSMDTVGRGAVQVRGQLQLFFALFPDYQVELHSYATNDACLLASGEVAISLTLGQQRQAQIKVPVFMQFEFSQQRISKEVFHLDMGLVGKYAKVSPEEIRTGIKALIAQQA